MPGILYHLGFAEEVSRRLDNVIEFNKINFMAGNLIPDLAINKEKSHYRKKASVEGFYVPIMELVKNDLFVPEDSIKFGMYCHLYLDYYFIEDFLIPEFIWDTEYGIVTNPRNHKRWDIKTFFSPLGMYGSYTEINQLLIQNGNISLDTVLKIPDVLPDTGIDIFDIRRTKTWRAELDEYLAQKKDYTGDIFDYNRLWNCILKISNQFVQEISE